MYRMSFSLLSIAWASHAMASVPPTNVADSVASFSGVQGHLGWNYGYAVDPTASGFGLGSFQAMLNFDPSNPDTYGATQRGLWSVSPSISSVWTALTPSGGHGNGVITSGGRTPVEQWAVRRWVSDVQASVTIGGRYADTAIGGNGTHARIFLDGTPLWDQRIFDGTTPTSYSVTATLAVGSILDFAIDPEASDDRADTSMFTSVIDAQLAGGDTDFNGNVDFTDLLAVAKHFGAAGSEHVWSDGDFNNDGVVDFGDLLIIAKNYGSSISPAAADTAQTGRFESDWATAQSLVPEPTFASALGVVGGLAIRRRWTDGK